MLARIVSGINPSDNYRFSLAISPSPLRCGFKGDLQCFISVTAALPAVADINSNRLELDDAGISLVSQQAYRRNSFRVFAKQREEGGSPGRMQSPPGKMPGGCVCLKP